MHGHHLPHLWRAAGANRRVGNRITRSLPVAPRCAALCFVTEPRPSGRNSWAAVNRHFIVRASISPHVAHALLIGIGGQIAPTAGSRPGELHPEPLTGPDVSLSTYPARTTLEGCRLPPRPAGSSCCQLTLIDLHVGRLPPSLHENYPASPLLRSSPLLTCASVLSASRFCRLCLSP